MRWPFKPGDVQLMGFIQVDIEGHSRIFEFLPSKVAMELKENLAKGIEKELSKLGLRKVFWAGDGGLFAKPCRHVNDYNDLIYAADYIFRVLNKINKDYSEYLKGIEEERIRLRVSAHCCQVILHPSPEYWHSPDLNFFIKNERDIAFPDGFTISEDIYRHLDINLRRKFPTNLSFSISGKRFYVHSNYKVRVRPLPIDRLRELFPSSVEDIVDIVRSDPRGASYFIGDCVIFNQSLEEKGYNPHFIRLTFDNEYYQLPEELESIVKQNITEEDIRGDKTQYRIIRFKQPLTDLPIVECKLQRIKYSIGSALQRAMEKDPNQVLRIKKNGLVEETSLRKYLVRNILDFPKSRMANFLTMHIVVVTQAGDNTKSCIVCMQRGDNVRYYPGFWSISIEEQIALEDRGFLDCIRRGIREELIGSGGSVEDISLQCFFVEAENLNQGIVAIAKVPYTFEELCDRRRSFAPDIAESKYIVGIPIEDKDLLISILKSSEFKDEDLRRCYHDPYLARKPSGKERRWHPTSKLRLFTFLRRFWGLNELLRRLS